MATRGGLYSSWRCQLRDIGCSRRLNAELEKHKVGIRVGDLGSAIWLIVWWWKRRIEHSEDLVWPRPLNDDGSAVASEICFWTVVCVSASLLRPPIPGTSCMARLSKGGPARQLKNMDRVIALGMLSFDLCPATSFIVQLCLISLDGKSKLEVILKLEPCQ
ncbi:hypothetical protein B0T19DRAFT_146162 [Cercophora scortea]|uniref:Uncharacterized protein n=1 Tax=Cercophora scortea TaxID=314031 RepID=A0AAE0IZE4_9PEZI|nr:hypothetical protein B0T19DRAFT_146162 [Cercophora scortea]